MTISITTTSHSQCRSSAPYLHHFLCHLFNHLPLRDFAMAASQASSKASAAKKGKAKAMQMKTKPKRVSKIARGRLARSLVLRGSKEKTVGGLTSNDLVKNKRGKIVSKRASAVGTNHYRNIKPWLTSFMEARQALQVRGFVAINGNTLQGKALYVKSKALCAKRLALIQSTVVEKHAVRPDDTSEEKCKVEEST
eukprot:TRINITY_DN26678_c1_g1_i1.p1 TRINITY_DN26678_c1_g1~~TRINITY_DN26678_c1_g1_i1.p1  ORF type:complete len:195 (-),score=30.94 TRINITY_DN26678_c1_g1_i1:455-1039(-)